jgi:hypothetical protein
MRKKNYFTVDHCGAYTTLTIFTGNEWERYERNNRTGYCKNYFTGKRISSKLFDELKATCKYAF